MAGLIHKANSAWFEKYGTACGVTYGDMSPFDADVNCPDCLSKRLPHE
jgi:hypothetical protein